MRRRAALLLLVSIAAPIPVRAAAPPYRIIVHPTNRMTDLEQRFVAEAFLKKTTRWQDGGVIKPVDLAADSPVRQQFSEDVLKRSVGAVKSYWQQMIFSGRDVPPPELKTDEEVLAYVLKNPGAIGYVSGTAAIGDARVVTVR
jgi:ABC-type phosphate transport system substrate-binding protein